MRGFRPITMSLINKKTLNHLAELARIELTPEESKKYLKDLKKILDYFGELKGVNTEKVKPLTGGTDLQNVFREDVVDFGQRAETVNIEGRIIDAFPETERGYLKVPKIL